MTVAPILVPFWVISGGVVVFAGGLVLLLRALFWDWLRVGRHHRMLRCPKCWYNMYGLPSMTCPECGHTAKSERHLHRSRWYWRRAVFALLLSLVGATGAASQKLVNLNWIPYTPSFVLIWVVDDPALSRANYEAPLTLKERLVAELWRRYGKGKLSLSQRRAVTTKQYPRGRPPLDVETRARWPAGVPVRVELVSFLNGVMDRELRATPRFPNGECVTARERGQFSEDYPSWPERQPEYEGSLQCIGSPPAGSRELSFDVSITEGTATIWSGVIMTAVHFGGTVDEILKPVDSPAIDDALAAGLVSSVRLSPDGAWVVLLPPRVTALAGTTMGLAVEILCAGEVVAKASLVWTNAEAGATSEPSGEDIVEPGDVDVHPWQTDNSGNWAHGEFWRELEGDTARLRDADLNDPRWQVRIRGDGALALWDFHATRYWSGSVTLPATHLRDPLPEPKSETDAEEGGEP